MLIHVEVVETYRVHAASVMIVKVIWSKLAAIYSHELLQCES